MGDTSHVVPLHHLKIQRNFEIRRKTYGPAKSPNETLDFLDKFIIIHFFMIAKASESHRN